MATHRRKTDPIGVSFFPFLSILVGVIGVLILVIVGSSLAGIHEVEQYVELAPTVETEKSPVYVECQHGGVVIHPEGTFVPREALGNGSSAWHACLKRIGRNSAREYLILLVRPSGVDTFDKAFGVARTRSIDIGYDPVYSAGPIRFRPPEAPTEEGAKP